MPIHPALHSWREQLPAHLVRLLAYGSAVAVLSLVAAQLGQTPAVKSVIRPVAKPQWVEIERPFPAFDLAIPEAASEPAGYATRRHAGGGGRKDILTVGQPGGVTPFLQVEIYRPGGEAKSFGAAGPAIEKDAEGLGPADLRTIDGPLASKFGPLTLLTFKTTKGPARYCLGFARVWDDPLLRLSGWFCQGESLVRESTLACALDRLTLLSAGSEPKTGALFAQAELNRGFCGQRDPLLAATPKYHLLWKALNGRGEQRRPSR